MRVVDRRGICHRKRQGRGPDRDHLAGRIGRVVHVERDRVIGTRDVDRSRQGCRPGHIAQNQFIDKAGRGLTANVERARCRRRGGHFDVKQCFPRRSQRPC